MPPELDDNDDTPNAGNVSRFHEKLREIQEGDDDEPDDGPAPSPIVRTERDDNDDEVPVISTRRQKKQERLGLLDELKRQREENASLVERMARLEGAASVTSQLVTARGAKPDPTDEVDPYQKEFDAAQEEGLTSWKLLQAKGKDATQADVDAHNALMRKLDFKKAKIAAESKIVERGLTPNNPNAALSAVLEAENADVYANPRAVAYARSYFQGKVALGETDSRELFDRSMNAAREAFKMQPKGQPPSNRQRRQFEGGPRGANGGKAGQTQPDDTVRMDKHLKKIARAMYPGLPEEKAYEKWAVTVGPDYLKDVRNSRNG